MRLHKRAAQSVTYNLRSCLRRHSTRVLRQTPPSSSSSSSSSTSSSSSPHCASRSWRSEPITGGSAPELQQPNCDILPLLRVCSGWLAAALAPWSKNHLSMTAPPRDKSLSPTSGRCGRISKKKLSPGSVLNWDRSVGVPGARRAAKRNRDYGCLKGKRNSWTGFFRHLSRICAALPLPPLKETSPLEATRFPAPAAAGSLCYSPLVQLLERREASPS